MIAVRVALCVALCVALAAFLVSSLWSVPWVPMNDGAQHLFGAWARLHANDVAAGGDDVAGLVGLFAPNQPVTSNGYAQLFLLLEPPLGWRDAHRAILTIVVLSWAAGVGALAAALHRRRALAGALLGIGTALSWSFYMGFLPFLLATSIGFFISAAMIARAPTRSIHWAALAAALAVQATVHVFAALVTGVVLVVLAALRAPAKDPALARAATAHRARALLATVIAGVPAAIIALLATSGGEGTSGTTSWEPLLDRVLDLGACFMGGPWWRAWPPVLVAVVGAIFALRGRKDAVSVDVDARAPVDARASIDRALLVAGALLVAVSFVIPETASGWQGASTRSLSMGILSLAVLVPIERLSRGAHVAVVVFLSLCALSSIGWSSTLHQRTAVALASVYDFISPPPPTGSATTTQATRAAGLRFSMVAVDLVETMDGVAFTMNRRTLPRWEPLRGIGALVCVAQGGVPWNVFAGVDAVDHVLWTDEDALPQLPSEPYMASLAHNPPALARFAMDVARPLRSAIIFEPDELHEEWLARGWLAEHKDRHLLIARFEGCSAHVTPPTGAVALESAMAPRLNEGLVRRSPVGAGAAIAGLPCGPVAVRFLDEKGAQIPCARATVELTRGKVGAVACE